ncbi:MAG: magnesium chelatase domain-containing protein, partial [Streptosporangiaceae bacterium]
MTVARTCSAALMRGTGHVIEIEADIADGPAGMSLAGLPDTARDRIRAAIVNSGEPWPQQAITVRFSRARPPGYSSALDTAVAIAVLAAAGAVPEAAVDGVMFFAELGLDGRLRPTEGVLPAVTAARAAGSGTV